MKGPGSLKRGCSHLQPSHLCRHAPEGLHREGSTKLNDTASSRRPSISNARSVSTSNIRSHSRSGSSSSIDASMLSRYGYPTYRQSPTPQPPAGISAPPSRTPSAMNHLAPIAMPIANIPPNIVRRAEAQRQLHNEEPSSIAREVHKACDIPLHQATGIEKGSHE